MSFLDDINPVKAAKSGLNALEHVAESGLHAVEHAGSSALHTVEDASSTLFHAVVDKPVELVVDASKSVASAVTHLDITSIEHAIGSVVAAPVTALVNGVSGVLSGNVGSVVKSVEALAAIANPLGGGTLAMNQIATGQWESQDKKISVQKVESVDKEKAAVELKDFWAIYDKQHGTEAKPAQADSKLDGKPQLERTSASGTQALDFSTDVFAKGEAAAKGDPSHEYTNASGEKVKVHAENGAVNFQTTKDGKVVTQATQTEERSTLGHYNETANLDRKTGVLAVTSEEIKLLQNTATADITRNNGEHVVRKGNEYTVLDAAGKLLRSMDEDKVRVGNDVTMLAAGADLTQAGGAHDGSDQTRVLTANDGRSVAYLPGGAQVDLRQDRTALIKFANNEVIAYEGTGKLSILKDGKFVPIEGSRQFAAVAQATAGALQEAGMKLDDGKIQFSQGEINVREGRMNWRTDCNEHRSVDLNDNKGGVTVKTEGQTVQGVGDTVTAETKGASPMKMDLGKQTVDTEEFHMDANETRIHHQGRKDTIVSANNTVKFDGGDGPILNSNGSMKLDEQTFVDSRGHVSSGSWSASAGTSERASSIETSIGTTSSNAAAAALNIYGRAACGMVTLSDIGALNQSLADISGLMSQLMAAGRGDLMGELQSACSAVVEAINFATPKAQAAQVAMDQGITSPFIIKAIEDGSIGRTPNQAANNVLVAA